MPCYVIYWNNVVRNEYNQNDRTVHPIRMLSYVTGDPTSCKAWIFLVGCFVYAVLGGVTGYLQSEVLAYYYNGSEEDSNSKTKGWQWQLIVYPIIVGLSGMLLGLGVRLLSYDKYPRAGIATHVIVAGIFQMFSIIYCVTAIRMVASPI